MCKGGRTVKALIASSMILVSGALLMVPLVLTGALGKPLARLKASIGENSLDSQISKGAMQQHSVLLVAQ